VFTLICERDFFGAKGIQTLTKFLTLTASRLYAMVRSRGYSDNFFAARTLTDLDNLNAQAQAWCEGPASCRPWPEDAQLTVRQATLAEQASLMGLPEHDYPVAERVEVHVANTAQAAMEVNAWRWS
jgi:hypothetical protein